MAETSAGNLNFEQDLISGFGNLPLGYSQGAFTLQNLADYVFPAAYEKIDTSTFNPQATAALLDEILVQAVGSADSGIYQTAQQLVSDVATGALDPELAASTLLLTDEGKQLSMMNPAFGEAIQGVFTSASKMGEDTRALQTGDIVQFDDGYYRRRTDKERNDLLADVGLDNALSNPDLYGFEKRQRELSGVDDFIRRFAAEEENAALQGGNAAKRLAEAESVMAAFLDQQEAERESRPGSRAATGARRPVQNAGVAAARDFDAGVPVESVIPDDLPDWLVEAGGPRLSGSQMVPPPMNPVSAQSRSNAGAGSRGRTVTSPAPYTDADLRQLRDEARDAENRQKMAAVQRKQQELIYKGLANSSQRYMAPASQLLNEGLSQMGAAVAPAPRVSKPKIKLDSDTIARLVRGG
jgi:hypothetical protein